MRAVISVKTILLAAFLGACITVPVIAQESTGKIFNVAIIPIRNSSDLSGVHEFTDSLKLLIQARYPLRFIDGEEFYKILKKRNLHKKNPMDEEFASAAGKFVGADYLFNGEVTFVNDAFSFTIHFRDVNQLTIIKKYSLSDKNKQKLFHDLLMSIVADLSNYFAPLQNVPVSAGRPAAETTDTLPAPDVIASTQADTANEVTETEEPEPVQVNSYPCNDTLYKRIRNLLVQAVFSQAFSETKAILTQSKDDKCIIQSLIMAYSDAAARCLSEGEDYNAYYILVNGVYAIPDEMIKKPLADLYRSAAKEATYKICIKKEPSKFSPTLKHVKKKDILTLHPGGESLVKGWYKVDLDPRGQDTTFVGWIAASSVQAAHKNILFVAGKEKKENIDKLFAMAKELNPELAWKIFFDRYTPLLIIITSILIIIMMIIIKRR